MEYAEFRTYVDKRRKDLERTFDRLDFNHSGRIDSSELVSLKPKPNTQKPCVEACQRTRHRQSPYS